MTTQNMLDILLKKYATDPNVLYVSQPRKIPHGGIALEVCIDSTDYATSHGYHLFGTDEMLQQAEAILINKKGYPDRDFNKQATSKALEKGHGVRSKLGLTLFPMEQECWDRVQKMSEDLAKWGQYTCMSFLQESGEIFFPKELILRCCLCPSPLSLKK